MTTGQRPAEGVLQKRVASRKILVWLLLLTVLPWSWFVLRDRLGLLGDLLAILLPVLVIVLAGLGVLAATRRVRWLVPAVSVLAMGLVATVGPWLPADAGPVRPGAGVSVLGANVMGRSSAAAALVAAAPDVLVISELSRRTDAPFAAAYPYRRLAAESGAVGVYSQLPLRPAEPVDPEVPGVRVQVDGPAGGFVLYALHVPRPWYRTGPDYQATPAEQYRMVAALTARIAAERLPVVVVGDLNLTDRGRGYRLLLDGGAAGGRHPGRRDRPHLGRQVDPAATAHRSRAGQPRLVRRRGRPARAGRLRSSWGGCDRRAVCRTRRVADMTLASEERAAICDEFDRGGPGPADPVRRLEHP